MVYSNSHLYMTIADLLKKGRLSGPWSNLLKSIPVVFDDLEVKALGVFSGGFPKYI